MKDGTAYLDFSEAFRFNSLGKEGLSAQLQQVVYSATEFSTVKRVQILLEGKTADYLGPEGLLHRQAPLQGHHSSGSSSTSRSGDAGPGLQGKPEEVLPVAPGPGRRSLGHPLHEHALPRPGPGPGSASTRRAHLRIAHDAAEILPGGAPLELRFHQGDQPASVSERQQVRGGPAAGNGRTGRPRPRPEAPAGLSAVSDRMLVRSSRVTRGSRRSR